MRGKSKALASLGVDAGSPYAAFVLVEVAPSRQMELNGKKYNIFTAAARLNFRLVRSDGSIVYSLPIDEIKGQGGTQEAAVGGRLQAGERGLGSRAPKEIRRFQDRPGQVAGASRAGRFRDPGDPCRRDREAWRGYLPEPLPLDIEDGLFGSALPLRPAGDAPFVGEELSFREELALRDRVPPFSMAAKPSPSSLISVLPSHAFSSRASASLKASADDRYSSVSPFSACSS